MKQQSSISTSHADWHCTFCSRRGQGMSALDVDDASAHLKDFPDHALIMILTSTTVFRYVADEKAVAIEPVGSDE